MDSPWPAAAGAGEQARRGRRPRRSDGLESADLAISYDGERLEALEVRRGSLTADFDLFAVHTDPQSATIRVGLGRSAGPINGQGPGIVYLPFECYLCNRMVTNCGRCGVRPVKHADLQRTCAECLARGDLPSDS